MERSHDNDVSIGKDEWIEVADLSGRNLEQAVPLDQLFEPIKYFWKELEIHCVLYCCGFDAFSFWPEDVKNAGLSQDARALNQTLAAVKQFVEQSEADIFVIHDLGKYFDKQAMIQFIDHIQRHAVLPPSA